MWGQTRSSRSESDKFFTRVIGGTDTELLAQNSTVTGIFINNTVLSTGKWKGTPKKVPG